MSDIDSHLTDQVAQLSTQLMAEVTKLLLLEETILSLRKELNQYKRQLAQNQTLEDTLAENKRLAQQLDEANTQRQSAEEKNKQLEGEVEELTASLFNEANKMVLNASRETHNFKIKNGKLIEELAEKDAIIGDLQTQLKDLKAMIMKMEDDERALSRAQTPRIGQPELKLASDPQDDVFALLGQPIYAPKVRAVRYDLPAFQLEFKGLVYQLIRPDFNFDLSVLKTLRYFRSVWTAEIEPAVPTIPAFTGNFINRWSKGKTFWSLVVEGKAIIEPVHGVNETFKLTYKGDNSGLKVPVAISDPCAFCGEHKSDVMEHARLYTLKLYGPSSETGNLGGSQRDIGGEAHEAISTNPLCNFCLVKLRAVCEFFAKLRLIHANIYRLDQNSTFDDVAHVPSFQFNKRATEVTPRTPHNEEAVLIKLYQMILAVRAKLFWARVGIWDTDEDVEYAALEEVGVDVFGHLHQGYSSNERADSASDEKDAESTDRQEDEDIETNGGGLRVGASREDSRPAGVASEAQETETGQNAVASSEEADAGELDTEDGAAKSQGKKKRGKKNKAKKSKQNAAPRPSDSDDDAFEDSTQTFSLSRQGSTSKAFLALMNKGLDSTMKMLEESLKEGN